MLRIRTVSGVICLILILSAALLAQSTKGFEGIWKLDPAPSSKGYSDPSLVISSADGELSVHGSSVTNLAKYNLSGARTTSVVDQGSSWAKSDTKLDWDGDKLVLTNRTLLVSKSDSPDKANLDTDPKTVTSVRELMLDGNGQRLIVQARLMNPNQPGPKTSTLMFKRK